MNNFAWVMIAIVALFGIMAWAEKHDRWVMEAAGQYEDCVRKEYGVSPAYWYAEHGEYPTCPNTVAN